MFRVGPLGSGCNSPLEGVSGIRLPGASGGAGGWERCAGTALGLTCPSTRQGPHLPAPFYLPCVTHHPKTPASHQPRAAIAEPALSILRDCLWLPPHLCMLGGGSGRGLMADPCGRSPPCSHLGGQTDSRLLLGKLGTCCPPEAILGTTPQGPESSSERLGESWRVLAGGETQAQRVPDPHAIAFL